MDCRFGMSVTKTYAIIEAIRNTRLLWTALLSLLLKNYSEEMKTLTFKWRTIFLRFSLYSSTGTCCLSPILPARAASLAPKKIVVATGGLVEP